jgi:hypothetical protein
MNTKTRALLGFVLVVACGCHQSTTTGPYGYDGTSSVDVKRLTLTAAKEQAIRRGETDKILVLINRDNFSDPVTVRLTCLPKGISILDGKDAVIASGDSTTTMTIKAAADAELGPHQVTLSAEVAGIEKNSQVFRLTVNKE